MAIAVVMNWFNGQGASAGELSAGGIRNLILETLGLQDPRAPSPPGDPYRAPSELVGMWRGAVSTYQGDIPFALEIPDSGPMQATLGEQPMMRVQVLGYNEQNQRLTAYIRAQIGTEDALNRAHIVYLQLTLRGDHLNGNAAASSPFGTQLGHSLSHWADLTRVSGTGPPPGS